MEPELQLANISDTEIEVMPRANGVAKFAPLAACLPEAEAQVESLVIRATDTPDEITKKSASARRLRLDVFRATRVGAKKIHTELKAGILEIGRELDGAERELRLRCEKWEAELEAIETHAARMEQQQRQTLREFRAIHINPYLTGPLTIDLADLTEEQFSAQLADARDLHEMREAKRIKEEEERKAQEAAKEVERLRVEAEKEAERVRLEEENRRLEAERKAEREAAEAERKRIEAEREAERRAAAEERRKLEEEQAAERARLAEEARKAEAEQKRLADEAAAVAAAKAKEEAEAAAAKRRAASAPDAAKIATLTESITALVPEFSSPLIAGSVARAIGLATAELARIRERLES